MIQRITNIGFENNGYYFENKRDKKVSLGFRGMSRPSEYKTTFDYMAAKTLDAAIRKYSINRSMISAANIKKTVNQLFNMNRVFGPYCASNPEKISWKNYIPDEVRIYCTDKVNDARAARLKEWHNFLENPSSVENKSGYENLIKLVNEDNSLKFVVWHSINSELQTTNRHIPVPFDIDALNETVQHFNQMQPKMRTLACGLSSFLPVYTHNLRNNTLKTLGLADEKAVWVKIPSLKKDPQHKQDNISALEILSYKNWCTRSSVDKAEAALTDGDFYVYLDRDETGFWDPVIGMASSRGEIDQIQGKENNNFIPLNKLEIVKKFLADNKLKCRSDICSEGPKAYQQILIAQKLYEVNQKTGKTLFKAIREKDYQAIFTILGKDVKYNSKGECSISTYKPQLMLNSKSGIVVPYSFAGIDEDLLLSNVVTIDGDFCLFNKNSVFSSCITKFPPKLTRVNGRIICTAEQYEKFKKSMLKVVQNPSQICVH